MLVPMAKVEIIGHRDRLDDTLELLHRLRTMQLLDAILRMVPMPEPGHQSEIDRPVRSRSTDLRDLRADLEELGPTLEQLTQRLDDLRAEQQGPPPYVAPPRPPLPPVPPPTPLGGDETGAPP